MTVETVLIGIIALIMGLWFVYDCRHKQALTDQVSVQVSVQVEARMLFAIFNGGTQEYSP